MTQYDFHPVASMFPLLAGAEYLDLVESIRANGLREPITLYEGKILDGRNRYNACITAGVTPTFEQFSGDDPWAFAWDENAHRRHLPKDQMAMCKVKYDHDPEHGIWLARQAEANRKRSEAMQGVPYAPKGEKRKEGVFPCGNTPSEPEKKRQQKPHTERRAEALYNARPDLADEVAAGMLRLTEAQRQKKRDEVRKVVPLPDCKYRVIYADPPWKYDNSGIINDDNYGRVERHYPAMSMTELCLLPIEDLAADNAVLFLWTTSPMLEDAFRILIAWDFDYKASFVWDKVRHNFGHYNSVRHEFLLVCTRGSCLPDVDEKIDSVQTIERSKEHSEKPEEFRAIIDRLYPTGKRIELFARKNAVGWETWGNECKTQS